MTSSIFQNKPFKKIFVLSLVFVLLFFLFNLFYSQNKDRASAQDTTLACDPEIPIGEAFDKTAEIVNSMINEIQIVQSASFDQIEAARNMIDLALNHCGIFSECSNPGCPAYRRDDDCWDCNCREEEYEQENEEGETEIKTRRVCDKCCAVGCHTPECEGPFCEHEAINNEFNKIGNAFVKIEGSPEKIKELLKDSDEVRDKLYKARQEFDNCALSPSDWLKAEKGEKTPKYPLNCVTVLESGFQRKEEECGSLFNFFCCQ